MEIKTILSEVENLIVIEKSKFLGYLFPYDKINNFLKLIILR